MAALLERALLAAAGLSGLVFLSAALSGMHWVFDFAGQFLLPATYILFAAGLALGAIWLRRRTGPVTLLASGLSLIASLGILIGMGPARPEVPDGEGVTRLSVYQHNVWIQSHAYEASAAAIRAADADIVALVEAWPDAYDEIAADLSDTWPYSAAGAHPPAIYTRLRLLSKYPIASAEMRFPYRSPAILQAEVTTPSGPLNVILVHFTRPWPFEDPHAQMRQLEGLGPWLEASAGPTLLLGDFNSATWGRLSRKLQSGHGFQLANDPRVGTWPARVAAGHRWQGLSWPQFAGIPIDLAFCRGGAICIGHKVAQSTGSDHYSTRFEVVLDGQDN